MIGLFCLRQKTPNIKNHGHSIKNVEKHVKMQGTQTTAETKRNNSTNKTTKQQRKQHETTTQTKQRNNSTTTTAQQDETTAPQTQACGIARARLPKVLPKTPITLAKTSQLMASSQEAATEAKGSPEKLCGRLPASLVQTKLAHSNIIFELHQLITPNRHRFDMDHVSWLGQENAARQCSD